MLTQLSIRDYAIVESLELEFGPGMTTVTGETGAGKSIMVDALGLLLGDRSDAAAVRTGTERAEIAARFDVERLPGAQDWLAERELDLETHECVLRRTIGRDGRSRAWINGSPLPLASLRELGERLVDIHGQHEHQSLMQRDAQRALLDAHAGLKTELTALGAAFQHWARLRRRIDELAQRGAERDARLDMLRYQVRELEDLALGADELPQLEEEHARLANAGRLLDTCRQVLDALYEGEPVSAQGLLGTAADQLGELAGIDAALAPLTELVGSALIQVQEAADGLRRYLDRLDLDPRRLGWLETRLGEISALARKHRQRPEDLPGLLDALRAELDELEHGELRLDELTQELAKAETAYRRIADQVGAARAAAAVTLGEQVGAAMHELGMPGGRFAVELQPLERPTPAGLQQIEFMVSANPGQPLRPLAKVASGGELARISLALQVITAHGAQIPTLIFDEVDTGIGGGVAEIVGRRLRELGSGRQVLCVTHLPQVAAQAHRHLQVHKQTDGESTATRVIALDAEARVQEIARMLGGIDITARTLAHAREMIARGQA
ncbi:MAG TPA: DNA repair protein RecN [Plasticicumulans sp.]|uniref:DNA repair protein RecN n=2 Tax=Plasticicumulans sp. TaxID=2307179 RepID=UPI002C36308A|nr:DNA repair protein RecN [Plasticicumulans sp.]HMV38069.1 DNA repair protein RecN [Plasticicumulans sp.]HMW28306.1 DNA repair protein RecN [Plasticicumulans sp.]HNF66674.1 DNA repair protein RecN [Plasticicumulans sp.]HNJ07661.1 DNA repair protein RecN [Plasticicumulans sp.]